MSHGHANYGKILSLRDDRRSCCYKDCELSYIKFLVNTGFTRKNNRLKSIIDFLEQKRGEEKHQCINESYNRKAQMRIQENLTFLSQYRCQGPILLTTYLKNSRGKKWHTPEQPAKCLTCKLYMSENFSRHEEMTNTKQPNVLHFLARGEVRSGNSGN